MHITDYSTLHHYTGTAARPKQQSVRIPKPAPIRKKKLNYNSREIRGFLLRAVRSQTAGLVLNTAKSKLVSLLKCKGSGMYNENELNAAIGHARRMVRCAQLKLRNLTKEEQQQARNEKAIQKEAADPHLDHLQKNLRLKQRKLALEQKRRMHRNLEMAKLNQADREYKNRQARDQRERDQQAPAVHPTPAGRDLSELKLLELELEISREEILLNMEAGGGTALLDGMDGIGMEFDGAAILEAGASPAGDSGMSPAADAAGQVIDLGL